MVRKAVEAQVSSKVLQWARESSGYSVDNVAAKLKIPPELVSSWEAKDSRIRFSQIVSLAALFKRPEATLLLSKPPSSDQLPPDFRNKGKTGKSYSPQTLLTIRRVKRLQQSLKTLLANVDKSSEVILRSVSVQDNPREIADKERASFGFDEDMQSNWRDAYDAFNFFKHGIESKNIFIFQMKMLVDDCRGFSFADESPHVILLNQKDSPAARNFTLFHEYAHLLLKSSGVCTPSFGERHGDRNSAAIESWCDKFSATFLMPAPIVIKYYNQRKNDGIEKSVSRLYRFFGVSKQAFLYRLFELDLISESDFRTEYAKLEAYIRAQLSKPKPKSTRPIIISPSDTCINEKGTKYTSLVLSNLDSKMISPLEFTDFLSLKIQHVDKLREKVARKEAHV